MKRALPEMLHCLNKPNCADMTVLEKQRSMTVKWQNRQQQEQSYFNGTQLSCFQGLIGGGGDLIGEAVNRPVKPDPGWENGWPELGRFEIPTSGFGFNSAISRTASCPPAVAAAAAAAIMEGEDLTASEKMCSAVGRESFKKRKAHNNIKVASGEIKDKRIKTCPDDHQTVIEPNNDNRETILEASKDDSKASEVQNKKPDYIHVRARRGQATDSHSLAERVRREKISERMKYLQDLVPGCNKITGKAGMLDEIINYVQSLQRQVEFLSMKIATLNPETDFNIDNVFAKEMFPSTTANYPIMMSPEMANPAYLQFNPTQQAISGCGLEIGLSSSEMALRRTISAPVSIPEQFMDSSCFTQIQSSSEWNGDLQNLYNV